MQEYKNSDELYHYGIPGMKWGHRKIKRMEDKQRDMISKKQMGTKKYVNLSNDLYINKKKQALQTAKKNKDSVAVQNLKYDIKQAKGAKKYGPYVLDGKQFKSMYKVNKSTREGMAVMLTADRMATSKNTAKKVLKTVGRVGVTALATAPAWYPKVTKGRNFVSSVDMKTVKYDWKTGTVSGMRKK